MSPDNSEKVSVEAVQKGRKAPAKKGNGKMPKQSPTKKMTAAQRIEMLEKIVVHFKSSNERMLSEIDNLRNGVSSINRRLNASISATETEDAVKDILVSQNIKELEGRIELLTSRGILVRNDEMEVVEKCFVVGRDVDDVGKVTNPRVQFAIEELPEELKSSILGKKLGDMVKPEDAPTSLEIMELYEVHEMQIDQQFTEEPPEASAEAEVEAEVEAKDADEAAV